MTIPMPIPRPMDTDQDILEDVSASIQAGFYEMVIDGIRDMKKDSATDHDVIVDTYQKSEAFLDSQSKSIAIALTMLLLANSDFDPRDLRKMVADGTQEYSND